MDGRLTIPSDTPKTVTNKPADIFLQAHRFLLLLFSLGLVLATSYSVWAQDTRNFVDTPGQNEITTGNTVLTGWHCQAQDEGIEAQFNNDPSTRNPIALTNRQDIPCDNKNNAFVFQFLWSLLLEGENSVQFFLGNAAAPFATRTVTVLRVKSDTQFLTDASGECTGTIHGPDGFRTSFRADWKQGLQNVSIVKTGADVCPDGMVDVGPTCVDIYESGVFGNAAGTGTQYGVTGDDYPCSDTGNDCRDAIYAVSQPGLIPSTSITYFQAQQACANVGKSLLTNAQWQRAAAGTPDPGDSPGSEDCNTSTEASAGLVETGSLANCVSVWGTYDQVGNAAEWVADWMQGSQESSDGGNLTEDNSPTFGNDMVNGINEIRLSGEAFPPGVLRGGAVFDGDAAGVFALRATFGPSENFETFGFRCGQPK